MSRYRPPLKILNYGESGARKSSFAKTLPKPLLVLMCDPRGKDGAYMKDYSDRFLPQEAIGAEQVWDLGGGFTVPYRDIQQEDGVIRLEYYHESEDLRKPKAFKTFMARLAVLHHEYGAWASVVVDSLTALEFISRKEYEYNLLVGDKYDQRHYYGGSSHDLEELLMHRFPGLPMNVCVISHIHLKETGELGGELVRLLSLPGQLKKTAPRAYGEFYRSFVGPDGVGWLQTKAGAIGGMKYYAASQINASNPCEPFYWRLWNEEDFGK